MMLTPKTWCHYSPKKGVNGHLKAGIEWTLTGSLLRNPGDT